MTGTPTLARAALDQRLADVRSAVPPRPPRGWIRAFREALGMTQEDLGHRLKVTKQAVRQLEVSEADDSIRVGTLRRAAEALDSTLVYAFVPNTTLDQTVEQRARVVAHRDVERAKHAMLLEGQPGGADDADRLVADLTAAAKNSRGLWRDS